MTNWTTIIANGTATAATSGTLIDMVSLNKGAEQTAENLDRAERRGADPTGGSLCYTPLGRAYYQRSLAPVFTPGANLLHGELQIAVQRSGISTGAATGLTRTVIIPDSGSTRIVLDDGGRADLETPRAARSRVYGRRGHARDHRAADQHRRGHGDADGVDPGNLDARKLDVANSVARTWLDRLATDASYWTSGTNPVMQQTLLLTTLAPQTPGQGTFQVTPLTWAGVN